MERVDVRVLEALKEFDSATIFNAVVERQGVPNEEYTGPEIRALLPELGPIIGYAVTAELTPLDPDSPELPWEDYYDYLATTPGPTIAVMKDVDSRPHRAASFGDGMARLHKALGSVGGIVDGSIRDLAGIRAAGFPMFASGAVPGHGPFHLIRYATPVTVGRLRVRTGDLLFGDLDGVVRIPLDIAADVARIAGDIRRKERAFFDMVDAPDFTIEQYKAWKD